MGNEIVCGRQPQIKAQGLRHMVMSIIFQVISSVICDKVIQEQLMLSLSHTNKEKL